MLGSDGSMARMSILTTLLLVFLSSIGVTGYGHHQSEKRHWVDIWASMPQLTEPANLPPTPFVSSNPVFQKGVSSTV